MITERYTTGYSARATLRSRSALTAQIPFKALMNGDQFDNTCATKSEAHEKKGVDKG
jgi:hypothetical protein